VSENQLYDLQCVLIALLLGAFLLRYVVLRLRRTRPELKIGKAVAVAFGARVFAAFLVSGTSVASQLRGGDELTFISKAHALTSWDLVSTGTTKALTHEFHVLFFSLNFRVFDRVPDMMLRLEVIAFAVAGLALLAAAVYELAGSRAATITAWVLALEPTNIFFSGILHKEPFMLFAEGLVAYGGALLWKRGRLTALVPLVVGCLIATATRPYVGWFLAAAAAAVALHAGLRRRSSPATSIVLVMTVIGLGIAFFPTVWSASSHKNLSSLQSSQDANAADKSANLSLERVDYSTRGKIIVNLPTRVLDIITKPYPWQLQNASQQLGLLGTVFLLGLLVYLVAGLAKSGGGIMRRAGPLVYLLFLLLIAYSLSAGNAGTAFRYRTHLVMLLVALVCVVRARRQEPVAQPQFAPLGTRARSLGSLQPALPHSHTT
jgi:hypothetical protein